MKISKSLIQAIAIAVTISTVVTSCTKENPVNPDGTSVKKDGCLGCGRG